MRFVPFLAALLLLPLSGCFEGGPLDVTAPGPELSTPIPAELAVERPFGGHFRTTFGLPGDPNFDCDGNPDTPASLIQARGVTTHLGATTYVSDSEIDFGTGIQCGRGTFTSARGDQVQFDYVGPFTIPDADGNLTFSGEWWVTGGTGRFEGATGGGTYEGGANAFLGQGEVSFFGTLDY